MYNAPRIGYAQAPEETASLAIPTTPRTWRSALSATAPAAADERDFLTLPEDSVLRCLTPDAGGAAGTTFESWEFWEPW